MEILLILAVIPSIVLGFIIWKNDKVEKEPFGLLVGLFFSGIGSAFLTLLISSFVMMIPLFDTEQSTNLIELFFAVFIGVALIEEFSKWIFVRIITWKNKNFSHMYDGVVYAVFVSLGFATFENILYVIDGGLGVAIMRALLAVPLHTFCGVFMGYYFGLAKQSDINNRKSLANKNVLMSLLVPIMIHGFYDYCIFTGMTGFTIAFYIFVILLYIFAFTKIHKLSKIRVALKYTFCTNCGVKSNGSFCPSCGCKKNL